MPDTPLKEGGLAWGRSGEGTAQGKSPADIHSVLFPCEILSITLLSTTQLVKRAHFSSRSQGPKKVQLQHH